MEFTRVRRAYYMARRRYHRALKKYRAVRNMHRIAETHFQKKYGNKKVSYAEKAEFIFQNMAGQWLKKATRRKCKKVEKKACDAFRQAHAYTRENIIPIFRAVQNIAREQYKSHEPVAVKNLRKQIQSNPTFQSAKSTLQNKYKQARTFVCKHGAIAEDRLKTAFGNLVTNLRAHAHA